MKELGYIFRDDSLLEEALTHSSYANEHRKLGLRCNERLEFLGDAVLNMIVAQSVFQQFPDMPEGWMTKLRAELVCEKNLVTVAEKLGIGDMLRLGRGEELGGGRNRPSILADSVEALLAAVFLDGGLKQAEELVETYILEPFRQMGSVSYSDYKTLLQERVQRINGQILSYRLTDESGPDHRKVFTVEVQLNGKKIGAGEGGSKKEAEQNAAKDALEAME